MFAAVPLLMSFTSCALPIICAGSYSILCLCTRRASFPLPHRDGINFIAYNLNVKVPIIWQQNHRHVQTLCTYSNQYVIIFHNPAKCIHPKDIVKKNGFKSRAYTYMNRAEQLKVLCAIIACKHSRRYLVTLSD